VAFCAAAVAASFLLPPPQADAASPVARAARDGDLAAIESLLASGAAVN
jgi:hypothetical protein